MSWWREILLRVSQISFMNPDGPYDSIDTVIQKFFISALNLKEKHYLKWTLQPPNSSLEILNIIL